MTFSEQFIQIIDNLCEKFGLVIDWSAENVVPYLTDLGGRLVQYELLTSIAWLVLPLVGIIGSVIVMRILWNKTDWDEDVVCNYFFMCAIAVLGISLLFGAVMLIEQVGDIITCCTIPEKIIIDFLKAAIN